MEYRDHLSIQVEGYSGKHAEIIKYAPQIFDLLGKLSLSTEIDLQDKKRLYLAIGYFVIPYDLYSEDTFGPIGYIDDLLLAIHVLNEIKKKHEIECILEHWGLEFSIIENLINDQLPALKKAYPKMFAKLKSYVSWD